MRRAAFCAHSTLAHCCCIARAELLRPSFPLAMSASGAARSDEDDARREKKNTQSVAATAAGTAAAANPRSKLALPHQSVLKPNIAARESAEAGATQWRRRSRRSLSHFAR